jgi:hypothetical protein
VGKKWQLVGNASDQMYVMNKYRVLLTRARRGMVIWIPRGDASDPTRDPSQLDLIAQKLRAAGVPMLTD